MARRSVEVRSYQIEPGERAAFHELMSGAAMALLRGAGTDVVAFGPSPHDEVSYLLVRAYSSLAARQAEQDAFYGSDAWRAGPREPILARIAAMTSVCLDLDERTVDGLRAGLAAPSGRVVEVRGLEIVPGERDAFHRIFAAESRPLLARWGQPPLAHGPSPHDDVSYAVLRAYASLADRQERQDAFYDSADWRQGPREKLVSRIAVYTDAVLALDEPTIDALRLSL